MPEPEEVPDEVQAAMALKLVDDVRKLVREEIKSALEDYDFMDKVNGRNISRRVSPNLMSDINFHNAVKQTIISQMNKY